MLDEACRQVAEWGRRYPGARPLRVCVNISVRQFSQPNLVDQVEGRLRAHGVDPRSLKLEITESAIMNDPGLAADVLARLRAIGVQIGIDDFGTGYSSLSYLRRFPVDTLKIDRTFVERMHADTRDREIVQAIVRLAHNLSMDVVAEGVETHDQRDELRTLGCEHGQGFYFWQAMAGPDAEALLSARRGTPESERGPRTDGNAASRPAEDAGLAPACSSLLEARWP